MSLLPRSLHSYLVPASVVAETTQLLREPGALGLEAVVVWVGRVLDRTRAEIVAAWRPRQIAYLSEHGVAVEVPPDAISELIRSLSEDLFILVRLHTHPHDAYHSETDDQNMLIGHNGAISIVVPDFAAEPLNLLDCSVNELRHGVGWVELEPKEVAKRFRIL